MTPAQFDTMSFEVEWRHLTSRQQAAIGTAVLRWHASFCVTMDDDPSITHEHHLRLSEVQDSLFDGMAQVIEANAPGVAWYTPERSTALSTNRLNGLPASAKITGSPDHVHP